MARSLFTNKNNIIKNTLISGDIDEDKIVPHIEAAQDIDLFNLLGQNLYERIDDLVADNEIRTVGNENYLNLLRKFIVPMIEQYAAARFLQYARYTVSEKGVFVHSASNSTPASKGEVDTLIQNIRERAERYATNMYDHLCTNSELYPEYVTTDSEQTPPSHEPQDFWFRSF